MKTFLRLFAHVNSDILVLLVHTKKENDIFSPSSLSIQMIMFNTQPKGKNNNNSFTALVGNNYRTSKTMLCSGLN